MIGSKTALERVALPADVESDDLIQPGEVIFDAPELWPPVRRRNYQPIPLEGFRRNSVAEDFSGRILQFR
ncbi:MAG: hypothetical protein FWE90_05830 [Defluviitaleaceae bacterium]|nr:hypothetical protein [Defluviitaleaceae bacterium]